MHEPAKAAKIPDPEPVIIDDTVGQMSRHVDSLNRTRLVPRDTQVGAEPILNQNTIINRALPFRMNHYNYVDKSAFIGYGRSHFNTIDASEPGRREQEYLY